MDNNGWITDRLPTLDDTDNDMVWVWVWYKNSEYAALCEYSDVRLGTPWQPIIEPPPYVKPRWTPKKGEEYWYFSMNGVYMATTSNEFNKTAIELGNCFQTQEEAQEVFNKFKQLLKEHHDGR